MSSEDPAPLLRTLAANVLHTILRLLSEQDGPVHKSKIVPQLPGILGFGEYELERVGKGQRPRWRNTLWCTADAVKAGLMKKVGGGKWEITDEGRKALALGAEGVLALAKAGYREERERGGGEDDVDGDLDAWARMQVLRDGLQMLAAAPGGAMALADFMARLPSRLPDDLREELDAYDRNWIERYGYNPMGRAAAAGWMRRSSGIWTITAEGRRALEKYADGPALWAGAKDAWESDGADDEKLPYLGATRDFGSDSQALYRSNQPTVDHLVKDVDSGALALPDIQRPFVWKSTKVRDLLDSMFRGYPFGYILTWKSSTIGHSKSIGTDRKSMSAPHALVVDGQQRLTSLYAVMTGRPVRDKHFAERRIRIAFHPISGEFEVADASRRNNPEWLYDVSDVFTDQRGAFAVAREYLERVSAAREIGDDQRRAAERNIQRLANLRNAPIVVLEIDAGADEEQVAEIFVRINSKGQNLKQADFILTLLAVFWEEGRTQLERFAEACRVPSASSAASPFNRQLQPGADEMVRVSVAVGHRRARLSAAYQVLRGKDPQRNVVTEEARARNLALMEAAQGQALDPLHWHEFLKTLSAAGYKGEEQIQSRTTALYAYAFFLLGRTTYRVPLDRLRSLIGRWFTMSIITGRYVGGSTETAMEEDLARLRGIEDGATERFCQALEDAMAAELTNDFWSVTLPSRLESSSTRTAWPFFAAQCVLGAKALFSQLSVAELLDPLQVSSKKGVEVHHLYPKAWLRRRGIDDRRLYNQIANYAMLEWSDNIAVADADPTDYAPRLFARYDAAEAREALRLHALPTDWWALEYADFLAQRRKLMAGIVRAAFERLGGPARPLRS
jgi:hypothetical protein